MNKKDEALALQNKVTAEQAILKLELLYGPFDNKEIEHYRKALTKDGTQVINPFQQKLIMYLYDKDFGDPITLLAVHGNTDYIKMMIAAKRFLLAQNMVILPYVISSKVTRAATRKVISKKDIIRIENDELYRQIQEKYNNPKIDQQIMDIIGTIVSSSFDIIDWDEVKNEPGGYDGYTLPIMNDLLIKETLMFVLMI